jgi:hypothetical protein
MTTAGQGVLQIGGVALLAVRTAGQLAREDGAAGLLSELRHTTKAR